MPGQFHDALIVDIERNEADRSFDQALGMYAHLVVIATQHERHFLAIKLAWRKPAHVHAIGLGAEFRLHDVLFGQRATHVLALGQCAGVILYRREIALGILKPG